MDSELDEGTVLLKTPKGTRDLNPNEVKLREDLINTIKYYFELYGGNPIDTPVIECLDTVKNLYGEEFKKLVYTLDDFGGEKLLLRYDLTVPFSRYVVNNAINNFKRYQIGKVYRRDEPQISKGRYREFYQADFDIIGTDNKSMFQDTEIILLISDILNSVLGENTFKIIINSRSLLFDVLKFIGIQDEEFNTVCSSLDKLDKQSQEDIKNELLNDKKIDTGLVEKINDYMNLIIELNQMDITKNAKLNILREKNYISTETYDNINLFFNNIDAVGANGNIFFNPLLSRGLDYYTGIIYEAEYLDKEIMSSSIAAGGRYDNMLNKLGNRGVIPAIGVSIGVERIVTILEKKNMYKNINKKTVYVATIGENMETHKLVLINELRKQNIDVDYSYYNLKMRQQFDHVFKKGIKYMIILGESEVKSNTLKLKFIDEHKETTIARNDILRYVSGN